VIGLGCIGLSTCHHLSSQGLKVIGFEQYPYSGHSGTSSFGNARIWRHLQPNQESTDLMIQSQEKWKELEKESGTQLLVPNGLLVVAEENSKDYNEYASTATPDVQFLSNKAIMEKFPAMRVDHNPKLVGLWD